MVNTKTLKKRLHAVIPLQVKPFSHQEVPTLTGSAISDEAGTVLYGHYSMDYDLPGGDKLRLIANHNKSFVQLFLLTHDPEKLRNLPGKRPSSLVANTIASLNRYLIRSDSYAKPRSDAQEAKYEATRDAIQSLTLLLEEEREALAHNWSKQERLRTKVIHILEKCRDKNRLIANNPVLSEGVLGNLLYNTKQNVQHYEFNRVHPVSKLDQLDFSDMANSDGEESRRCFVWDSDLHIGQDELALQDSLRVICKMYDLDPGASLSNQTANRFQRFRQFVNKFWHDAVEWAHYMSLSKKPVPETLVQIRNNGLSITQIKPWYFFKGFKQTRHDSLREMINSCTKTDHEGYAADSVSQAISILGGEADGQWVKIKNSNKVIIRMNNRMVSLHYAKEHGQFFCLPNGEDLFTLNQISKKHLFLLERINLGLKAFFSRIPLFFKYLYNSLRHTVTVELRDDFLNHIHGNHPYIPAEPEDTEEQPVAENHNNTELHPFSLHAVLKGHGLMKDGQSLQEFVQQQLADSRYVIVREEHKPSPMAYNNPLHRSVNVARHFASFFVDVSERNPISGTLALAAYIYGAGAIIAPNVLIALLTKLHLKGLICGIKPVQEIGKWMSSGTFSEAISAATTLWQGIMVAGDLDNFFIQAISLLRDDPAEVAIIVTLAISLGYGLCKAIPSLQEEMGRFPWVNYAALGAKSGAAIYDTIMHPGDDWLLGSLRWVLRGGVTLGKLLVAPFVEAAYYGYRQGFLSGWQKSGRLFVRTSKQILAASADILLKISTIPLMEITGLFIHVPFRGITNFISRSLGLAGQWQPIGQALLGFATRRSSMNYLPGFRPSRLYGFSNPIDTWVSNRFFNFFMIGMMLFLLPTVQLLKNALILPLIDSLSLSFRFVATLIDPLSRLTAFAIGKVLVATGFVWDNSAGLVFQACAEGFTRCCNWVDNKAGFVKQAILEKIQVCRRGIYHWAFADEDDRNHVINRDNDYFFENPMRLERLPHKHDSTHCLLSALLNRRTVDHFSGQDPFLTHKWPQQAHACNDDVDLPEESSLSI